MGETYSTHGVNEYIYNIGRKVLKVKMSYASLRNRREDIIKI